MNFISNLYKYITNKKDYIIQLSTTLISFFFLPDYNMLLKMISLDSLFTSINFFRVFLNNNITESVIINKTGTLYKGSILDRYIYYIIQYMSYLILCNAFWCSDINILYYMILFSTMPELLNHILSSNLFIIIRQKKEDIIKLIIAKQCTNLIKFFSKTYLNKDIVIKHKEILILFNDYQKTVQYSVEALKNAGLIIVFTYVKNSYPNFYYQVSKYIYAYKTGGDLTSSFNKDSAIELLNNIVENKRWSELTKPNVYGAIIYLYQINEEKSDTLSRFITTTKYKFISTCAIWGLTSFSKQIVVAPILSLFMLLYKRNNILGNLPVLIIATIFGYFTDNYFITSIICQIGYLLLTNKITIAVLHFLIKQFRKKMYIIHQRNITVFLPLIFMFIYTTMFSQMINIQTFLMLVVNILYTYFGNNNVKNLIIYVLLLFFSSLSDFNIFHIIFNTLIIYFTVGIMSDRVIISLFDDIHNSYIYKFIYNKYNAKPKKSKLIFDVLDTDKYPSFHQDVNINKHIVIDNINVSCHVNNHIGIVSHEFLDLVNTDNNIFELSDNDFIKQISAETNNVKTTNTKNVITNVSLSPSPSLNPSPSTSVNKKNNSSHTSISPTNSPTNSNLSSKIGTGSNETIYKVRKNSTGINNVKVVNFFD